MLANRLATRKTFSVIRQCGSGSSLKGSLIMSSQDKGFYSLLVNGLSAEQQISLQSLMVLAEQKKAQIQSKQIERQGGYAFSQHTIPTSFQFNKP